MSELDAFRLLPWPIHLQTQEPRERWPRPARLKVCARHSPCLLHPAAPSSTSCKPCRPP